MTKPPPEAGPAAPPAPPPAHPDWRGRAVLLVAAAAALFHLYGAGVAPFTALVQRPDPSSRSWGRWPFWAWACALLPRSRPGWGLNAVLGAVFAVCALYLVSQHEALVARSGSPTAMDLAAGAVVVALVLLLAKRATGWGLVVVASGALAYALLGPWLPGFLAHRGLQPRPPDRAALPLHRGDLGGAARRLGRLRLPLRPLRRLPRRRRRAARS